jgi:hypothetical protein
MAVALDTFQAIGKGRINLSLLKVNKITQVVVGIIITAIILVATAATIIVVVARSQYSAPTVGNYYDVVDKSDDRKLYLLDVCSDPRNDRMIIDSVDQPEFGRLEIAEDQLTVTYYAPDRYSGNVTFEFTVANTKMSEKGIANIFVRNKKPEPVDFEILVPVGLRDITVDLIQLTDENDKKITDPNEADIAYLKIVDINIHENGTAKIVDGKVVFTPNSPFVIAMGEYTVSDDNDTAIGNIVFIQRNLPPVAVPDDFVVPYNSASELDVLANDWDPDNDTLTIIRVKYYYPEGGIFIGPDRNMLYFNPPFGVREERYYFEYTVTDDPINMLTTSSTYGFVYLRNEPPIVTSSTEKIAMNSEPKLFPLVCKDPNEGTTFTVELDLSKPYRGSVELVNNTFIKTIEYLEDTLHDIVWNEYSIRYTPETDGFYDQTFYYSVSDGLATTPGSSITIEMYNDPPVAVDYEDFTPKNVKKIIPIPPGCYDPNNNDIEFLEIVDPERNPKTRIMEGGKFLEYYPPDDFTGNHTFTYVITDKINERPDKQNTSSATMNIIIENTRPEAQNFQYTCQIGNERTFNIIEDGHRYGLIYDENGDELFVDRVYKDGASEVYINPGGKSIKFVGVPVLNVTETFRMVIRDIEGATSDVVTVTVQHLNTPPVYRNRVEERVVWTGTNLRDVYDIRSSAEDINTNQLPLLTVRVIDHSDSVTVSNSEGQLIVEYERNFVGTYLIRYVIFDGVDESPEYYISKEIYNNQPVCDSLTIVSLHWRSHEIINLVGLCRDEDIDERNLQRLTISFVTLNPSIGTVVVREDSRTIEYRPIQDLPMIGTVVIEFRVIDGRDESETRTITINVVNRSPEARDILQSVHWALDIPDINLTPNNVFDPDRDPLIFSNARIIDNIDYGVSIENRTNDETVLRIDRRGEKKVELVRGTVEVTDRIDSITVSFAIDITNTARPQPVDAQFSLHWREAEQRIILPSRDANEDVLTYTIKPSNFRGGNLTNVDAGLLFRNFDDYVTAGDNYEVDVSDGLHRASHHYTFVLTNTRPVARDYVYYFSGDVNQNITILDDLCSDGDGDPLTVLGIVKKSGDDNVDLHLDEGTGVIKVEGHNVSGSSVWRYSICDICSGPDMVEEIGTITFNTELDNRFYRVHWRHQAKPTEKGCLELDPPLRILQIKEQDNPLGTFLYVGNDPAKYCVDSDDPRLGVHRAEVETTLGESNLAVTVYNTPPRAISVAKIVHWRKIEKIGTLEDLCIDNDVNDRPHLTLDVIGSYRFGNIELVDNEYRYIPDRSKLPTTPDEQMAESIHFTCGDGMFTSTGTITITITNNAPTCDSKPQNLHFREVLNPGFGLVDICVDSDELDRDKLTYRIMEPLPRLGRVELSADGKSLTYITDNYVIGDDVIEFEVYDGLFRVRSIIPVNIRNAVPAGSNENIGGIAWSSLHNGFTRPLTCTDLDGLDQEHRRVEIVSQPDSGKSIVSVVDHTSVTIRSTERYVTGDFFTYQCTDGFHSSPIFTVNFIPTADEYVLPTTETVTVHWAVGSVPIQLLRFWTFSISNPFRRVGLTHAGDELTLGIIPPTPEDYGSANCEQCSFEETRDISVVDDFGRSRSFRLTVIIRNGRPIYLNPAPLSLLKTSSPTVRSISVSTLCSDPDTLDRLQFIYDRKSDGAFTVSLSADRTVLMYTPQRSISRIDTIFFRCTDGNLQREGTYTIDNYNVAPVCTLSYSRSITRGSAVDIPIVCTDANGDVMSIDASTIAREGNTALTVTSNGLTLSVRHSGSADVTRGTIRFRVMDTDNVLVLRSELITAIVEINNRPPNCGTGSFSLRMHDLATSSFTPPCTDPDGDRLTYAIETQNCFPLVATVSVPSAERFHFVGAGGRDRTCTVQFTVTDGFTVVRGTIRLDTFDNPPVVPPQEYRTQMNTELVIDISEVMKRVTDIDGETYSFVRLGTGDTECTNPRPGSSFCFNIPRVVSNTQIVWPFTPNRCQTDRVRYFVRNDRRGTVYDNILSVKYENCQCHKGSDMFILLDGSSSLSARDWENTKTFSRHVVETFNMGSRNDQINVGVLEFSTVAKMKVPMSNTRTAAQLSTEISRVTRQSGTTGSLFGVQLAQNKLFDHQDSFRARWGLAKIMIMLTDGQPNEPHLLTYTTVSPASNGIDSNFGHRNCRGYWRDIMRCRNNVGTRSCEEYFCQFYVNNAIDPYTISRISADFTSVTSIYRETNQEHAAVKGYGFFFQPDRHESNWKFIPVACGSAVGTGTVGNRLLKHSAWDKRTVFNYDLSDANVRIVAQKIADEACDVGNIIPAT